MEKTYTYLLSIADKAKALPKGQSSRSSFIAHIMLSDKLEGAKTKRGAIMRIKNFAEKFARGGKKSVGGC